MVSKSNNIFRKDKKSEWPGSAMGFVHIYWENTAKTMKPVAFVMYPALLVFVSITADFRCHMIEHSCTLFELIKVVYEDIRRLFQTDLRRNCLFSSVHGTCAPWPVQLPKWGIIGFHIRWEKIELVSFVAYYCSEVLEENDMSSTPHEIMAD